MQAVHPTTHNNGVIRAPFIQCRICAQRRLCLFSVRVQYAPAHFLLLNAPLISDMACSNSLLSILVACSSALRTVANSPRFFRY